MDTKRIADYFVIAGVPDRPRTFDQTIQPPPDPITDITVIIRSHNEPVPEGYVCLETTPTGHKADLNHGSIRSPSIFLCYRRGRDKPPLVDVGVWYCEGKEMLSPKCSVILRTPSGFPANVNNSGTETYLTFRRAAEDAPRNQLVVTEICVILANKNETPPHAFMLIDKNLNKGMFGSDVYLCYKKSMDRPPFLSFPPVVIDRFPLTDYPQFSLPEFLPHFCLPMGASIECWPHNVHRPYSTYSTFVLTSNEARKIYGALLNFYEVISPNELTLNELKHLQYFDPEELELPEEGKVPHSPVKVLYRIKSICILSHWPFFEQFRRFLTFLCKSFTSPNITPPCSLESYIFSFMRDIPFPSVERPNILVNLSHSTEEDTVLFTQTFDDLPLPFNGASFKKLLFNLGPENCLHVLLFALTEQKILLHSLRPGVLTEIGESITTMIFPFNWTCVYIPMCPMSLHSFLHAPLPFIIGLDSRFFDHLTPPSDVASIDIDTKAIFLSESKRSLNLKILPKKETKTLRHTLDRIYERLQNGFDISKVADIEARKRLDKQIETQIQEAFLHFMASILKDFRQFLKPITAAPRVGATDLTTLFDVQGFVQSRDPTYQQFFKYLVRTQMFTKFIEERSFVSDKNVSLAFFDECIEKVEKYERYGSNGNLPNLIDFDDHNTVNKTVFITIPDTIHTTGKSSKSNLSGSLLATNSNGYNSGMPRSFERFDQRQFEKLEAEHNSQSNNNSHIFGVTKPVSDDLIKSDSNDLNSELQMYPLAKRAKHEIRKAQRLAQQASHSPVEWAKCLLVNAYSLWFTHFPSYSYVLLHRLTQIDENEANQQTTTRKMKPLSIAYQVLQRMQATQCATLDDFCYRILMILCGIHSRPALAVKVFLDMQKYQVSLNAITYGYYNKAVLEGNWPAEYKQARWATLRNICWVVFHLTRRHIKHRNSSLSLNSKQSDQGSSITKLADEIGEVAFENKTNKSIKRAINLVNRTPLAVIPNGHATDYCENVGIIMTSIDSSQDSSPTGSQSNNAVRRTTSAAQRHSLDQSEHKNHKRNKSADSKPNGNVNIDQLVKQLRNGNCVTDVAVDDGNVITATNQVDSDSTNFESSKSDIHPETTSESSAKENGSEENLNESFSNRFATPIKEVFTSMDFFSPKSRVGATLRSSFRMAKSLTKSTKYGFARNSTLHNSEKNLNNMTGSLFGKRDEQTPPKMPRSSTLPQSFQSELASGGGGDGGVNISGNTATLTGTETRLLSNTMSPWDKLSSGKQAEYFYSSIKSAANRLNESFKSSLTSSSAATNSPVKLNMSNASSYLISQLKYLALTEEDSSSTMDGATLDLPFDERDRQTVLESHRELFEILSRNYNTPIETTTESIVLKVEIISCSICRLCNSVVYDEEIMCQWGAEDSNLNTKCIYCGVTFVPSLTILIKDFRNERNEILPDQFISMDPISVPYLSPLVLRKELESILANEGYTSLIRCKFVDSHPIVYWNMLWYFTRLGLPSHMPALALTASTLNTTDMIEVNKQYGYNEANISIVCLWDNESFYENTPLHRRWLKLKTLENRHKSDQYAECKQLIEKIRNSDVMTPIKLLISYRNVIHGQLKEKDSISDMTNRNSGGGNSRRLNSIYRELFFLSRLELDDHLNSDTFDQQYLQAFESLIPKEKISLEQIDRPPTIGAIFCRNLFKHLLLC